MAEKKNPQQKKNILAIDKYDLDRETAEQPDLYRKHAKIACQKRFDYDTAKANHEVLKAQIELEVRRDPEKFGLSRITEDLVKAVVTTDQRLIASTKNLLLLKKESAEYDILTDALQQRKKSIEDLIQLFFRDYFAKPKTKKAI